MLNGPSAMLRLPCRSCRTLACRRSTVVRDAVALLSTRDQNLTSPRGLATSAHPPTGRSISIAEVFADPQVRPLAQSVTRKDKGKIRLVSQLVVAHALASCRAAALRPASIPMPCSRNSAFQRAKSPRCNAKAV